MLNFSHHPPPRPRPASSPTRVGGLRTGAADLDSPKRESGESA
ncbi:hypothetical protein UO65_0266 [Actinokineospora spheciospongiae]|uniref:Uncharacterized protein n=1 Tax=Actinokineospora spheciospongiae TaxID=909613 RepID=W7JEN0_9PSEU|nr:hypothetical protein UO65_0266 [Actinokineospora spheciospongiae]